MEDNMDFAVVDKVDGRTTRSRMRGVRPMRGGRVRGGRCRPGGRAPVVDVADAQSGPSKLGGEDVAGAPLDTPGHRNVSEIELRDIGELPEKRGPETTLQTKRKRMRQSSLRTPTEEAVVASPSPAPASLMNHGSDDDTDEDVDDEDSVAPIIPRVFRCLLETPFDSDGAGEDAAEGEAPAANPAPAANAAPANEDDPEYVQISKTERPWRVNDFEWRVFPNPPIQPESRREKFSQINVGPTTPCADPYDIFVEIWDRQIMEHIVLETNKYAEQLVLQLMASHDLHPRSRITCWVDTTVDELYVYFAVVLAMGILVKSRLEEYWSSSSEMLLTPGFGAKMSIDRFLLLSKCLHFNDNKNIRALKQSGAKARLYKIQPIISHLNFKFQSMYTLAQNIALDESLLMWEGNLNLCQLIPNKAAFRGIKTYEICESQTGYLWRFDVHVNKQSPPQTQHIENPLEASTSAIVLQLVRGLEHKGYTLWMDNYYQSPSLARRLKSIGFDCVGTLRTDRKFVPQSLHQLTKRNMRPGQIAGLTSGDVDVMVWRDMNRVGMISTYHGNGQQTAREATKPILIWDYNIMMGGVDKKDQLLAMYPMERKRTRVWYKKLFRRLLNVSVLNSYIIASHSSSISHRNFRIALLKSLLSKHSSDSLSPAKGTALPTVFHRLAEYPMGNCQRKRRLCIVCKKRIVTYCVVCEKTVCIDPCFFTLHSRISYII